MRMTKEEAKNSKNGADGLGRNVPSILGHLVDVSTVPRLSRFVYLHPKPYRQGR
jgi:hypothetical protein